MNNPLKQEREALRLTQADAARRVCVHIDTWRKWESGARAMPEKALQLWARVALDVADETAQAARAIREGVEYEVKPTEMQQC